MTDTGSRAPDTSHVPTVVPTPVLRHPPRRWLPWVAIIVVTAAALGIALPLTLGSSSSTATQTPKSTSTAKGSGLTGSFYSPAVYNSSLLFLRLVQSQQNLDGVLTVTTADASHTRLVHHRYVVTGSVVGQSLSLTLAPGAKGSRTVRGTYVSGVISIALTGGTKVSLNRGTLVMYRALVVRDRSILLT